MRILLSNLFLGLAFWLTPDRSVLRNVVVCGQIHSSRSGGRFEGCTFVRE